MDVQPTVQIYSDDEGRRTQNAFTAFINSFVFAYNRALYIDLT